MKKRFLAFIITAVLLLSYCLILSSCSNDQEPVAPVKDAVARVTVDVNPSIEFMVDEDNNVVSVTALNDDGAILIAGEVFVGKSIDEASAKVVKLCADMGYLIREYASVLDNEVTVSVSGAYDYRTATEGAITAKIQAVLESEGITGAVEYADALGESQLRVLVEKTTLYTPDEIDGMTVNQLHAALGKSRRETASLLTERARVAYYEIKDNSISFAKREENAKIINEMGGIYEVIYSGYSAALDIYKTNLDSVIDFHYSNFIDPTSPYQSMLASLREEKARLINQREVIKNYDRNSEEYENLSITIDILENNCDAFIQSIEELGEELNGALALLTDALKDAEAALMTIESSFSEVIRQQLYEKKYETEKVLNDKKDNFFSEFEKEHKEDIEKSIKSLEEQKALMIEAARALA